MTEPSSKTWYRVIAYVGPESSWERVWALRIQGDGELLEDEPQSVMVSPTRIFHGLAEIAAWGRAHATFIEMPLG